MAPPEGTHPPLDYPEYRSLALWHSSQPLVLRPQLLTEVTGTGALLGEDRVREQDNDLTRQHAGEPISRRIIVHGRLLDEPNSPVDIWQANVGGRCRHTDDGYRFDVRLQDERETGFFDV